MQNAGHHQPTASIGGTNGNQRAAGGREFGREITIANAQSGLNGSKDCGTINLPSVGILNCINTGGIQKKLGEVPASATA